MGNLYIKASNPLQRCLSGISTFNTLLKCFILQYLSPCYGSRHSNYMLGFFRRICGWEENTRCGRRRGNPIPRQRRLPYLRNGLYRDNREKRCRGGTGPPVCSGWLHTDRPGNARDERLPVSFIRQEKPFRYSLSGNDGCNICRRVSYVRPRRLTVHCEAIQCAGTGAEGHEQFQQRPSNTHTISAASRYFCYPKSSWQKGVAWKGVW